MIQSLFVFYCFVIELGNNTVSLTILSLNCQISTTKLIINNKITTKSRKKYVEFEYN